MTTSVDCVQPEAEPVAPSPGVVAVGTHQLAHPARRDDPAREERLPQRADVGDRRVDPAVAGAPHGQVVHVRPPGAVDLEVAERSAARKLVRAQELGVDHSRRLADALSHEVVERDPADPLGDQREHDVPAVAVREALAGSELRREAVEHGEILLGRRERVHRDRQQVIRQIELDILVEVVADPRSVRQQVLHRDGVVDQRQIGAEHGTRGGRELEAAVLDQAHDRQRRHALDAARGPEAGVDLVRDLVAAMRQAVRLRQFDLVPAVDPDHSVERGLGRDRVELCFERRHRREATGSA